jgi:hypothetical protein
VFGDRAITGSAASASQVGRFETKWQSRRSVRPVDQQSAPAAASTDDHMDSSESPTYGEEEGSAYNGHFGCTCYHPLFVF